MSDMLLNRLQIGGYATSGEYAYNNLSLVVPVVIQCFEADTLENLRNKTDLPLVGLYININIYIYCIIFISCISIYKHVYIFLNIYLYIHIYTFIIYI